MSYKQSYMYLPNSKGIEVHVPFMKFKAMMKLKDGSTLIFDDVNKITVSGVSTDDLINIMYSDEYAKKEN